MLGIFGGPSNNKATGVRINAAKIRDPVDRASSLTGGHWRVAIEPHA
jgi:hypothetical protein